MIRDDLIVAGYEAGRTELLERVKMRETVTLTYVVSVGAIFGIELGTDVDQAILMIVPALALGATSLIAYHNLFIASINGFFRNEVVPWQQSHQDDSSPPPLWDVDGPCNQPQRPILVLRFLADVVFLILPTVYVISRSFGAADSWAWVAYACVMLCVTVVVLAASYSSILSVNSPRESPRISTEKDK